MIGDHSESGAGWAAPFVSSLQGKAARDCQHPILNGRECFLTLKKLFIEEPNPLIFDRGGEAGFQASLIIAYLQQDR